MDSWYHGPSTKELEDTRSLSASLKSGFQRSTYRRVGHHGSHSLGAFDAELLDVKRDAGQTLLSVPRRQKGFALDGSRSIGKETVRASPVKSSMVEQASYCLSETTTLSTSCPSASLPLKVEVRVFPSLETFEVTVIITWPPFFKVDSIVSAPTRFTETVSA